MLYQRFIPEGWDENTNKYSMQDLKGALDKNATLQGKIERIDDKYNVYINLGDNIEGVIPNKELGNIMQNNSYVQFKVSSIENNTCLLSRKAVKEESLNWAINDLAKGDVVDGIVRNIKPYGAFVEIGGGTSRPFIH